MRIIRNSASTGFTKVPNRAIRDQRLSYKARGILAVLLSHKDEWQIDAHALADDSPDGRKAILSGLRELVDCGYIVYVNRRGPDGRMRKDMTVYEVPPGPGPGPGEQPVDNRPHRGSKRAPRSGENSQVAPRFPHGTSVHGTSADGTSVHGTCIEDQQEDQKEDHLEDQKTAQKISQSARTAEALRWLQTNYGLTDQEAAVAWKSAEARARDEIKNPVRYLERMAERGHLADIIGAIQTATAPDPAAAPEAPDFRVIEHQPTPRSWRAAIDACRYCDHNGMTTADPDHPKRCDHLPPAQGAQLPMLTAVDGGGEAADESERGGVLIEFDRQRGHGA